MPIDAGRENSERPTPSETDLRPPKWLARIVEALVPPELGSPNELIDVLLETHGSIGQAVLHIPVGWTSPSLMVAGDGIIQRAAKLAVPIALCRYLLGKDPGPRHPHKDLLRLANRTWFFNGVWMAGALVVLTTNANAVPPILPLQEGFTSFLTAQSFNLSWRLQLNPLDGITRHQRIQVILNRNPYIDDLKRQRGFLLTGADWFTRFSGQALFEMIFFMLLPLPLLIGVGELYLGYPGAAEINTAQMMVNGAGWVALLLTWVQLKKLNRQTAAVFDQRLRELRANNPA